MAKESPKYPFPQDHLIAIGMFVVSYSLLESGIHLAFSVYSGIPREMSRAITGGMRLRDVIERTKRIMKLNAAPAVAIEAFERLETELNPLSVFRDKIIHRVWKPSARGLLLIHRTAKSTSLIQEEVVTSKEIRSKIEALDRLTEELISNLEALYKKS